MEEPQRDELPLHQQAHQENHAADEAKTIKASPSGISINPSTGVSYPATVRFIDRLSDADDIRTARGQ
jgi:hypothetical protein